MLKYALHYLEEGLLARVCCVTEETIVRYKNTLMRKPAQPATGWWKTQVAEQEKPPGGARETREGKPPQGENKGIV